MTLFFCWRLNQLFRLGFVLKQNNKRIATAIDRGKGLLWCVAREFDLHQRQSSFSDTDRPESDTEVINRVLGGAGQFFEILVRRYNQRLYRVARSILGSGDEAEDVMQDAYLKAYQHLTQFAGRARFSTWLTRIVIHEALTYRKRRARVVASNGLSNEERFSTIACKQPGPLQQAFRRELAVKINTAIDGLPPGYRVVFVMREVEKISTKETAACLQVSQEVVKIRLHRAKIHLRRTLHPATGLLRRDVYPFHLRRCDRVAARVMRVVAKRLFGSGESFLAPPS